MLISDCEISALELLSHSQAAVRRNRCFSLLWQHFCFCKNYTRVKSREGRSSSTVSKEAGGGTQATL